MRKDFMHGFAGIVALSVFLPVGVFLPSGADAQVTFSFTEIDSFSAGGTSAAFESDTLSVVWATSDVILTAYQSSGDTFMRRCVISTSSCSTITIDNRNVDDTTNRGGVMLSRYDTGKVLLCSLSVVANAEIQFVAKTVNAGLTWSTSTDLFTDGSGGQGAGCAASPGGGAFVAAVKFVGLTPDEQFRYSTDEGASWVAADNIGQTIDGRLGMAALNDTAWLMLAETGGQADYLSTTTTTVWGSKFLTGVTENANTYGQRPGVRSGSTDDVAFGAGHGTTGLQAVFSQDSGAFFSISSNPTVFPGTVYGTESVWLGENHIGVAHSQTGTIDEPCWISNTDDLATWTDQELFTLGTATTIGNTAVSADVFGSNIVVSCGYAASTSGTVRTFISGPGSALASAASFTTNQRLVGFDVDPFGQAAIIRTLVGGTTSSSYVVTISANDMGGGTNAELGNATTNCNRVDGVASGFDSVFYVDCDDGAAVAEFMKVRTHTLGAYDWLTPGVGSGVCGYCIDDISLESGDPNDDVLPDEKANFVYGDDVGQIQNIIPVRGAVNRFSFLGGGDWAHTSWVFDTLGAGGDTRIGEHMYTHIDNARDAKREVSAAAITRPDDVCSVLGNDSNDGYLDTFIVAARNGGATIVYRVDHELDVITHTFADDDVEVLDGQISTNNLGPSSVIGVACENNVGRTKMATVTSTGTVRVSNMTSGGSHWTAAVTTPKARGIDMSYEFLDARGGPFVAVMDGDDLLVYNATGVLGCTIPGNTTGDFFGLRMDALAQNAWVARRDVALDTGRVDRYDLQAGGCTTTEAFVPGEDILPPTEGEAPDAGLPEDSIFADSQAGLASVLGSAFGANIFMGALLIGLVSFGVGTGGGYVLEENRGTRLRWSWPAACIGAIIGFLLAWGFGFFNAGVVFTVVVLAGLVVVFWLKSR